MIRNDVQMVSVYARTADDFVQAVNEKLGTLRYRIVHVEISVTDNFYFAVLVQSESK